MIQTQSYYFGIEASKLPLQRYTYKYLVISSCIIFSVAYMCINSEATGQTVYIDTTKAKATDNSSGPLCICNATISNAKFANVRVLENIATCGSKLKFDFTNKQVESDENKCRSTKELVQIENQEEVGLSLEKIKTPYSVDFCTKIEIGKKNLNCLADLFFILEICHNSKIQFVQGI
jgi:hypothetical protein